MQCHRTLAVTSALSNRQNCAREYYKHNEDGRTAPGVCGNGSVPLSHSGNVVTRIGIHTIHTECPTLLYSSLRDAYLIKTENITCTHLTLVTCKAVLDSHPPVEDRSYYAVVSVRPFVYPSVNFSCPLHNSYCQEYHEKKNICSIYLLFGIIPL